MEERKVSKDKRYEDTFVWNVFDTAVRHSEKYSHRQMPLK